MSDTDTLSQRRTFASTYNNEAWDLLEQVTRSEAEDLRMLEVAAKGGRSRSQRREDARNQMLRALDVQGLRDLHSWLEAPGTASRSPQPTSREDPHPALSCASGGPPVSTAEIEQLLHQAGAKRVDPVVRLWELAEPWWPLSRRARDFEALRTRLLDAAIALPGPTYLVTAENPQEYEAHGPWARSGEDTWTLPEGSSAGLLIPGLLRLGDWYVYCAVRPVDASALPDAFRDEAHEVADFALTHSIPFLTHAPPRSSSWRIWLEPQPLRHRAAA